MSIITISRGSASGGLLLAEGLAEALGHKLVSREDVLQEATKHGISEEKLQQAILKPVKFWERFQQERSRYLALVQAALCEHAKDDRIIYHGNAGHLLLPGVSHVLCVRLIAPASFRVRVVMQRQDRNRAEAERYITMMDRQRKDWTRFLYGVDWLDPNLYDLTISLSTLSVDGAVEVVKAAVQRKEFQTTDESRKAMGNLLIASRVRAALAANESTAGAGVEVRAEGDAVYLRGRVRPRSMIDSVLKVTSSVQGVREVHREDLDAPDYTV